RPLLLRGPRGARGGLAPGTRRIAGLPPGVDSDLRGLSSYTDWQPDRCGNPPGAGGREDAPIPGGLHADRDAPVPRPRRVGSVRAKATAARREHVRIRVPTRGA